MGLSPLRRRRTICPSISQRDFAQRFSWRCLFQAFSRVFPRVHTYALTQTTRKITVSGVCMCACVCVVVYCVCCAVLCVWKNTENQRKQREMRVVWCVCCVVLWGEKIHKNHGKHWENSQNMVSFFGTVWPSKDRKKVQKWPFSPTHCFYVSPGICRRFWTEVLTQTPKNAVFRPRSYSKGPNHALEKVLTKETPGTL